MAGRYSRTYKKRRRYAKRYRRYKEPFVSNYLRVKGEANGKLVFPDAGGFPRIIFTNQGGQVAANSYAFTYLLNRLTFTLSLSSMFGFYKMVGTVLEVWPDAQNFNGTRQVNNEPVTVFGIRPGSDEVPTFAQLRSMNSSMVLSSTQYQRKYNSFLGFFGDWTGSDRSPLGTIACISEPAGTALNSPSWTFKITVYIIYKKSRI